MLKTISQMVKEPAFIQTCKRNELILLMRKIGVFYGEKPELLDEYIREQVKAWEHDLDRAIACFKPIKEKCQ